MSHPRQSAAQLTGILALGFLLAAASAHAHDMLSFDPNAPPEFPQALNPFAGSPEPVVIQGVAIARLRPHDLEIDLTVADGAAYKLLGADPFQPPVGADTASVTADSSSGLPVVHDPHFDADKLLLVKRGESLFRVETNGQVLDPLAVAVDLTESHDVVFHITYPHVAPGPLRLGFTYFDQIPAGLKDVVTVLDSAEKTLATTRVGAKTPFLDVEVPGPVAVLPAPAGSFPLGKTLASLTGIVVGLVALIFLLLRLRRPEGT